MNVLHIAVDVVREAFARRLMLAVFAVLFAGILGLFFALDLEVVDGVLASRRLFGQQLSGPMVQVDQAMGMVFSVLTYATFYLGLMFGILATSGTAADIMAPGRVELLLSLPVRRLELVLGIYLGVLLVCLLGTGFFVGGVSLVLLFKAGFFTLAPLLGASAAVLGFLAVYGLMLLATALVRSTVLAASSGFLLLMAGTATSGRETFLSLIEPGLTRDVVGVIIAPLPRLHALAKMGADIAAETPVEVGTVGAVLGTLAFAGCCVALAASVVAGRDY